MPDLSKRIDPASFPLLGLLGAAACGPLAPQDGDTDSGTGGTSAGPTGPSSDPTDSTDPTDPTRPTTGEPPMPECQSSSDCKDTYCGYCLDGTCRESVGCCGYYGAERVDGEWRCSPPYYSECYSDSDCQPGNFCDFGECVAGPPIKLPACPPPDGMTSEWNLGHAPSAFVLADLDGDMDLDLAAAQPGSGLIEIALNDGAGNFVLAGAFGVGPEGSGEMALAVGDLDGDGDLDLVVTRREPEGVLQLLFNDGAVFTVGEARPTGALPAQVFIADVNGDGAPDLLTVNEGEPTLGIQLGTGEGEFAAEQSGLPGPVAPRAWVADFVLDGRADVLAPTFGGVMLGTWLGGGEPLLSPANLFEADIVAAALGADLNNDGLLELVFVRASGQGGTAEVWGSLGQSQWSQAPQRFLASRPLLGGVMAESDGLPGPDLVSATGEANVVVLPGDGEGGFACEHVFNTPGPSSPALIAVGDLDGDGTPEIVVGGLGTPAIQVLHLEF